MPQVFEPSNGIRDVGDVIAREVEFYQVFELGNGIRDG